MPDDKWDMGAGRGGQLWTGLCSPKSAGCVHQNDQLLELHPQHDIRDQAVRPSGSELVWEGCHRGQLPVLSTDPASEINPP